MKSSLEPLRFQRRYLEKVWGGRALARRPGIELPEGGPIGETWEVVDRPGENSVVAEGAFAGRTLRELMEAQGDAILGTAPAGKDGRFPLLVKYLDARENLSVQVHPDEVTAGRIGGGAEAKTEAWYVLEVEEGGVLYAGMPEGVRAEAISELAAGAGVEGRLLRWDVRPGDGMLVSGGTVHAIGAGVTILEVQENSDTTYRIWDWGRVGLDGRPRETHAEEALACAHLGPPPFPPGPGEVLEVGGIRRRALARSDFFAMDAFELAEPARLDTGGQFRIYALIEGAARLRLETGSAEFRMRRGDVWLVPAACGYHVLEPEAGALTVCEMRHRA